MLDPHDDTNVPSGSTDGAQMESTSSPVPRLHHFLARVAAPAPQLYNQVLKLRLSGCELARPSSRAPLFPETLGTRTPLPSSPGHGIGLPSPRLGIEALFRYAVRYHVLRSLFDIDV